MLIKETVTRERELHVAPCLQCGNADIRLTDSNYSSFNKGGGECTKCNNTAFAGVGCAPSMDELANNWNAANDIAQLLAAQELIIAKANDRIKELKIKRGPLFILLDADEKENCLMTAEEFADGEECGMLTGDDGNGVWATASHKSELTTYATKPEWATHVVWYNR